MNTVVRTGPNHGLHAVLTVFTCGMWGVVWLLVTILQPRTEVATFGPPPPGWPQQEIAPQMQWNPYSNRWENHPVPTPQPQPKTPGQPHPRPNLPGPYPPHQDGSR